jgi:hypothetical protein
MNKTVNVYRTEFFARCPNNGVRVKYLLSVETADVLSVEEIIAGVDQFDEGFHEEIADALLQMLGGSQTLIAEHHGVTIESRRVK